MKEIKSKIKIEAGRDTYELRLKKRCKWCWLWLLLLLPFLLLIPLKKTVKFRLINTTTQEIIVNEKVSLQYLRRDFFSIKHSSFFANYLEPAADSISVVSTDSVGIASFDLSYQLYQWVSFMGRHQDSTYVTIDRQRCYHADSTYQTFDLRRDGIDVLWARPNTMDIAITVVDADDNNEPLPDALVRIEVPRYGIVDSVLTDINGQAIFQNIPKCADVKAWGAKYGWFSDSISRSGGTHFRKPLDTLMLRQQKQILKFYVKDEITREALVGTYGRLYFKDEPQMAVRPARTNRNGIAKGVFDKAHKIRLINIHVNQQYSLEDYEDTTSVSSHGWISVENWNRQSDLNKTLFLYRNTLVFRTVKNEAGYPLLPEVGLEVLVDDKRLPSPVSSGNGEFRVKFPRGATNITIHPVKNCFKEIESVPKIENRLIDRLLREPQRERDIPLNTFVEIFFSKCWNPGRPTFDFYIDGVFQEQIRSTTSPDSIRQGSPARAVNFPIARNIRSGMRELRFVMRNGHSADVCTSCTQLKLPCSGVDYSLAHQPENVFMLEIP